MRVKLYLDTSVLGAICDPGPEDRLRATRRVLDGIAAGRWEGFISTLVLEEVAAAADPIRRRIETELRRCGLAVLEESPDSMRLARLYVVSGAIPAEYEDDARHIAIATVNEVGILVSWDFRHMVGLEPKRRVNSVNLRESLPMLDIVSPWELGNEED